MAEPLLTVLNFSGGKQSSALLWMVLRGDIPRPENFVVINANPGMENSETYTYVADMKRRCAEAGIYFETAKGPNLYEDILALKTTPLTIHGGTVRFDNPPYWTKDDKGKRGKLMQKCTKLYKIAPMDRAIRRLLNERHGISLATRRIPQRCVEKWIGFAHDEFLRIKESDQKYLYFRYPLIELKLSKTAVNQYFLDNGLTAPPRSVCNACFANGLDTFKTMYEERPADWAQAVAVDNAVRDWTMIGVEQPVFVSNTLTPLENLPKHNFSEASIKGIEAADQDGWSCDSGYCFT